MVLVGDHRQLPEIGPGGALAAAVEHTETVAELTVNRRQRADWEQTALTELRAGSVPAAVAAYRDHDRLIVASDWDTTIAHAVDRYLAAVGQGRQPVLMAGTNDTVTRLNQAVRAAMAETGTLDLTNRGRDVPGPGPGGGRPGRAAPQPADPPTRRDRHPGPQQRHRPGDVRRSRRWARRPPGHRRDIPPPRPGVPRRPAGWTTATP